VRGFVNLTPMQNFRSVDLKGVKNLLIDLGAVLVDLNKPRCVAAFKALGFVNVEDFLSTQHQEGIFLKADGGLVSSAEFRNEIRKLTGKAHSDAAIDKAWTDMLDGIPAYKLDFLWELKKRFRLMLISNISEIDWHFCLEHYFAYKNRRPEDYFDKLYLSYQMKLMKPNPEIMQKILEDSRAEPAQTLMIDDAEANCRMAESFGMRAFAPLPKEDWTPFLKTERF